jgi:predicted NUDIX family NTP pyrophosphohydrolase
MSKKSSAGLLMYRNNNNQLEVFLVHPGGPYFRNKDEGAWTIPKGEIESEESIFETAKREFQEETGIKPEGDFVPLDTVKQKGGKTVHAWAFEGDSSSFRSNYFEMEWPPHSGRRQKFPEVDKARFFSVSEAMAKINPAQMWFLERLEKILGL